MPVTLQERTTITPDNDVVYLVDFYNNGRPKYQDEVGDNGNNINDEKVKKDNNKVGIILVNNPLKNSEARADGIYFRPASGQPIDPLTSVSLFF